MKLKKGDTVMVIAGKEKGKTAKIVRVLREENRVLLDGVNLVKRHRRATRQGRKGQIVDIPQPLHVSNVMIVDPKTGKPSRIKITRGTDGVRQRIAVKSGQEIK
ncbi:MAG TPA: 50S ribosomal protein L24 [Candidatus Paceibacterota bacterium]